MEYEPKEGLDYIVDLYALTGVEHDTDEEEIKHALNERSMEYHPDRLEGLAPEFRARGELVAKLLNRARVILLDTDKRADYDEILTSWEGPISTTGIPAITYQRMLETDLGDKSTEEIEEMFASKVQQIEGMTGYSPNRLTFTERLVEAAGDDVPEDLRAEYEDALLQRDRVLAVEESLRSDLLGLPDLNSRQHEASLNYGSETIERIEGVKAKRLEEQRKLALGGVSARLALLAGEQIEPEPDTGSGLAVAYTSGLPEYFEQQAARISEIAQERENITDKRLGNFEPTYPEAELQTELKEDLIIGVEKDGVYIWFGMKIDTATSNGEGQDIPDEVKEKLNAGEYETVIKENYGIILIKQLEQINIMDLFGVAIGKYTDKYKSESSSTND